MTKIISQKDFENWHILSDEEESKVVCFRAALRTLPLLLNLYSEEKSWLLYTFRSYLAAFSNLTSGSKEIEAILQHASTQANRLAKEVITVKGRKSYFDSAAARRLYRVSTVTDYTPFGKALRRAADTTADKATLAALRYIATASEAVAYFGCRSTVDDEYQLECVLISAQLFPPELRRDFWEAINCDIQTFEDDVGWNDPLDEPLWHQNDNHNLRHFLGTGNPVEERDGFDFWWRWYRALDIGKPMPSELQREIALIPEAHWNAGLEQVADLIKGIEAQYFERKLPQAELLTLDPNTGKYDVSTIEIEPDALLKSALNQIQFALDTALISNSGFNRMCAAYKYLEHAIEDCPEDPNTVEQHFGIARKIILSKLESDEYRNDDGLEALTLSLERHEVQLRADHPEVRKAWETRADQKVREIDSETRQKLAEGFAELGAETQGRLEAEYDLDAKTVGFDAGVEATADAVKRSGGRSAKIAVAERAAGLAKKADGSAANKGVGLLMRAQKIVELLSGLF